MLVATVATTIAKQAKTKMPVVIGWPGARKPDGLRIASAEDEEGRSGQTEEEEIDRDDIGEDLAVGARQGDDRGGNALQDDGERPAHGSAR